LEQVAGARVAMRLEREHQATPRERAAGRGDGRCHFCRMMAVVIDERIAAAPGNLDLAVALEAPPDALELGERLGHRGIGHADFAADSDRGECVLYVVHAGEVELDVEVVSAFAASDETPPARGVHN